MSFVNHQLDQDPISLKILERFPIALQWISYCALPCSHLRSLTHSVLNPFRGHSLDYVAPSGSVGAPHLLQLQGFESAVSCAWDTLFIFHMQLKCHLLGTSEVNCLLVTLLTLPLTPCPLLSPTVVLLVPIIVCLPLLEHTFPKS